MLALLGYSTFTVAVGSLSDNRKPSRVGISVIFTDEENVGHGRRDSLYPSPIHEITSSAEGSPTSLKKMKTKYSAPQRKRGKVYVKSHYMYSSYLLQ